MELPRNEWNDFLIPNLLSDLKKPVETKPPAITEIGTRGV